MGTCGSWLLFVLQQRKWHSFQNDGGEERGALPLQYLIGTNFYYDTRVTCLCHHLPPTIFQFCEVKDEHQSPMGPGSDQSELPKPVNSQHLQCQVLTLTAESFGRSLVAQGRYWGLREGSNVEGHWRCPQRGGTPDIVSCFILMQTL